MEPDQRSDFETLLKFLPSHVRIVIAKPGAEPSTLETVYIDNPHLKECLLTLADHIGMGLPLRSDLWTGSMRYLSSVHPFN